MPVSRQAARGHPGRFGTAAVGKEIAAMRLTRTGRSALPGCPAASARLALRDDTLEPMSPPGK
jgi:hypothetical protein